MKKKAIFVAATGQNVGKTTLCLGILSCLKKLYGSVGFMKPVGQQHVRIREGLNVDKDVVLFKEQFQLSAKWEEMSPVIIPSGFTRSFLDKEIDERDLMKKILHGYNQISSQNAFTLVEGTGHVGVGAIVNLNNAKVAAELGLDMIMIASGGIGSAHDELCLNIELAQKHGVRVRGILLNRVKKEKQHMIREYFPKALEKWGIPLLGCIPFNEFLSSPTVKDFEQLLDTELIAGTKYRYCHFHHPRLVADSLESYRRVLNREQLIITPATRDDIILETLEIHEKCPKKEEFLYIGGIIMTGTQTPKTSTLKRIQQTGMPVLYSPIDSYEAMKLITSLTTKISVKDAPKIHKAIDIVERKIDFNKFTVALTKICSLQ